jgi:hypothetical protein
MFPLTSAIVLFLVVALAIRPTSLADYRRDLMQYVNIPRIIRLVEVNRAAIAEIFLPADSGTKSQIGSPARKSAGKARLIPMHRSYRLMADKGPEPAALVRQAAKPAVSEEFPMPEPVPIPAMSPEDLPAGPPTVSYRGGQLVVDAENSTLGEILSAIGKQIGAEIEKPAAVDTERVAAHFSGSPARVIDALLADGKFGYVILYPPQDQAHVQKVILTTQTQDPVRPGMAMPRATNPRVAATPRIDPGLIPQYRSGTSGPAVANVQVPLDTRQPLDSQHTENTKPAESPAASTSQPTGSELQDNMKRAESQMATALAAAQVQPDSPGTDTAAPPAATKQQEDKTPMQLLQNLYEARRQLQAQQNQAQPTTQNNQ